MEPTTKEDFNFYNELGEKYPESKIVYNTPSGQLRLKYIGKMLQGVTGRLLDVGCNNYVYEPYFKGNYVGVDIAKTLLRGGNRNGVWADCYALPFQDKRFDIVLCSEVLEHLPHRAEALAQMRRVLRDDGVIFLSAPYRPKRDPYTLIWSPILEKYGIKPRKYLHGSLTLPQMVSLAKAVGLVVVYTDYILSPGDNHIFFKLRKL
jgi:SAM-dependent methyltransferase